jgi:hypothetical protein
MSPLGPWAAVRIRSARRLLTTTWFDMMLPGGALYPANSVDVGFGSGFGSGGGAAARR